MNMESRGNVDILAGRSGQDLGALSFELSSRNSGLSFQRTRLSADRTLMSVIRTSLALIGFGFTIFQFFRYIREAVGEAHLVPVNAARNFGLALVVLGVGMQVMGIVYHLRFMSELRAERNMLEVTSVLIIAYGAIKAIFRLLMPKHSKTETLVWRKTFFLHFGAWLILGLEFELAADIVRSAIAPSWQSIGKLEESNFSRKARSWPFHKSAASIIAIVELPSFDAIVSPRIIPSSQ